MASQFGLLLLCNEAEQPLQRRQHMHKIKTEHEHTHLRDKEAMRQRILAAAEEAFATKGYHGAIVNDIVHSADISKGGFYFHFPNKQAIFPSEALTTNSSPPPNVPSSTKPTSSPKSMSPYEPSSTPSRATA